MTLKSDTNSYRHVNSARREIQFIVSGRAIDKNSLENHEKKNEKNFFCCKIKQSTTGLPLIKPSFHRVFVSLLRRS